MATKILKLKGSVTTGPKSIQEALSLAEKTGAGGGDPENFMAAVRNRLDRGAPVRAAIAAAARAHPALYREHLAKIDMTDAEYLDLGRPPGGEFEAKVAGLMAGGLIRGQAIKQVAHDFPELHQNYLDRVNRD